MRERTVTEIPQGGLACNSEWSAWPHGGEYGGRLMKDGHECTVFDRSPEAVDEVAKDGATGARRRWIFAKKLEKPRVIWLMVPAAAVDKTVADLLPSARPGDTIIDGGNSYYVDDIRRSRNCRRKGSTMSTSAPAAACGGSIAAIA